MNLVFLSKRRPQGRDLVGRSYGRFFHLPRLMVNHGHQVTVMTLGYQQEPDQSFQRDGIHWVCRSTVPFGPIPYLKSIYDVCTRQHPDWIIGYSDTLYGILAESVARRCGARSLIDAYDNYESYMAWAKPLHWMWRRALARADLVSAAGPDLGALLARGRPEHDFLVVPMAADPAFAPLSDRAAARRILGLPERTPLVGYCGAMYPNRGMEVLFRAFAVVRTRYPDARLVLSGREHRRVPLPADAVRLGYLPDEKVPLLVGSLDVLVVVNRDSLFGCYSHPAKLYEAMRCRIPVAATRTPATEWILSDHPGMLAPPNDPATLADVIVQNMERRQTPIYAATNSWEASAGILEHALVSFGRDRTKPDAGPIPGVG